MFVFRKSRNLQGLKPEGDVLGSRLSKLRKRRAHWRSQKARAFKVKEMNKLWMEREFIFGDKV